MTSSTTNDNPADGFDRPISLSITHFYTEPVDIRVERWAVGRSQSQLARTAGVPQPNLSAYENGRRSAATGAASAGTCGARTPAARPSRGRSSPDAVCGGRWRASCASI